MIDIFTDNQVNDESHVNALYIEDDVFVQKLVKMWLKKFPYVSIDMASSLSEINKFENNQCDVIVTDNLLGDGSATDVLLKIESSELLKNTPVLIYTGTVDKLSINELQNLGNVIDILPKPFEMKTFVRKLQMIKDLKNR